MKNTINDIKYTVNDQPIKVVNREKDGIEFVCKVDVGTRIATQRVTNLLEHVDYCNEWNWEIKEVTMYRPEPRWLRQEVVRAQGGYPDWATR